MHYCGADTRHYSDPFLFFPVCFLLFAVLPIGFGQSIQLMAIACVGVRRSWAVNHAWT